jgi:hypothetical protein
LYGTSQKTLKVQWIDSNLLQFSQRNGIAIKGSSVIEWEVRKIDLICA